MKRIVVTLLISVLIVADAALANASPIYDQNKDYQYREARDFSGLFQDQRGSAPSQVHEHHDPYGTYSVDTDPVSDQ